MLRVLTWYSFFQFVSKMGKNKKLNCSYTLLTIMFSGYFDGSCATPRFFILFIPNQSIILRRDKKMMGAGRRRYQARRVKAFPFNYNRSKSANRLQWHWRRRDGGFIDGQPRLARRPALKPPLKFAELFISIRLSNLLADCYLSVLRLRKGLKSQSFPLLSFLYFFLLSPLSMLFVRFLPLSSLPSRHLVKRVSLLHPLPRILLLLLATNTNVWSIWCTRRL